MEQLAIEKKKLEYKYLRIENKMAKLNHMKDTKMKKKTTNQFSKDEMFLDFKKKQKKKKKCKSKTD